MIWQIVASIMAIGMAGEAAKGQTTNAPPDAADSGSSTNVTQLGNTVVVGRKLDVARDSIIPNLGATAHSFDAQQIQAIAQGENAPFSQIILRAPGVAQDNQASGQLHVRGEHANVQYRINDVLLPEGITGFGGELDPRFVQSMELITGSLPAAYGFRTAGVVDIRTKSGIENGGAVSIYGGSYDTIRPSFEYGGTQGKWNFFVDGSYDHNALGIENPTPSHDAIHDKTDQYKSFLYGSYIIDDTSRLSVMGSVSYSDFQIPNTPGLQNDPANYSTQSGTPWETGTFDSAKLNERQNEQNYYAVVAYQKSLDNFNLQASVFGRESSTHFRPDKAGDLFFNGVASDELRRLYSGGFQADASYALNDQHTLRGGVLVLDESVSAHSSTTVIQTDGSDPSTFTPLPGSPQKTITDQNVTHAIFAGIYLQDEWKLVPQVTVNFGARFDEFYSSFDKENQPSPRVNLIYTPTDTTTLHAGYARYFTPPALETVSSSSVAKFDNTSNSTGNDQNSPVKTERANYFDAGATQKVGKHLQLGVDGYYKKAHEQIDDGLFGASLIPSTFNYSEGRIYGVEFTGSYNLGGFDAYANVAYSVAQGRNWSSSQFLFGPRGPGTDLQYVHNHWIYLDHDQRVSGSFGASYTWKHPWGGTRVMVDALYGSGLRTDAVNSNDRNVPNGGSVPAYYSVNLGAEESFKLQGKQMLKARVDVVNVTDNIYQLRDGAGVGVNAASYGERLGFFGSLTYVF
jgi:outer membrane receptor protein involved in Fe transport